MRPSHLLLALPALSAHAAPPLQLTTDHLINRSGRPVPTTLTDEQALAGDPRAGKPGKPVTNHAPGWVDAAIVYPLDIVVDLRTPHHLDAVAVFDTHNHGDLHIAAGKPGAWQPVAHDPLKKYNQWSVHQPPAPTTARYLKLTFASPTATVAELLVYARPTIPPVPVIPPPTPPPTPPRPTFDRFVGLNGFVDDPVDRLAAGGHLREYHSWIWDEGNTDTSYEGFPDNRYAWSPSWVSGPGWGWDFDAYYRKLNDAGIEPAPVLQGSAPFVTGHDPSVRQHKPLAPGEDPADPHSYAEHADYLFQFVARYGSKLHPDKTLKLRDGQPRHSGLGLVRYIENWNEPDRTWDGRAGHFKPAELAAMSSADYDGHLGALGKHAGAKNADPDITFVMAGLAFPETSYLDAMRLWCAHHRADGSFPADVLNFHHYSTDGKSGISPEADDLRGKMAALVAYRDRHFPGKEIWLSEFGYDTHPASPTRAPAINDTPAETVQARWVARAFLELAAAGIDRAQLYMLRDVDPASPTKYDTSGITSSKQTGHRPKPAWHAVTKLRRLLAGLTFAADLSTPDARIYKFAPPEGAPQTHTALALWSPTAKNLTVETPVPLPASVRSVTLNHLTPATPPDVLAAPPTRLTLTESPIILLIE